MSLEINSVKGKRIAERLYNTFFMEGIFERADMPEDALPSGVKKGSLEHVLFITLTVSIEYQREALLLWENSRKTFEDPETRYLFDLCSVSNTPFRQIREDMQKYKLSKKPKKDPAIWRTVAVTFYKKWGGSPINFLKDCDWESLQILRRLKEDTHWSYGRPVADYPYLRGDKIGPLWIRMLRDNVGITQLKNLEKVPIPVDIHVARATLATGVVKGHFNGRMNELFENIREAWFESVMDLKAKDRPMIALDVDEPLWHLSKYGCTKRDQTYGNCPMFHACTVKEFCIRTGKIAIQNYHVDLET